MIWWVMWSTEGTQMKNRLDSQVAVSGQSSASVSMCGDTPSPHGSSRRHRRAAAAVAALCAAALGSCADTEPDLALPPPVAALSHPAVARLGQPVTFSAANSAVATVAGRPDQSARLVKFRFQVADGSPAAETAVAQWQHTFSQPGSYAVSVQVQDDRGQTSAVQSSLQVVVDLAQVCSGTTDPGCPSGLCSQGVCTTAACAGASACPKALFGSAPSCTDDLCQKGN